MKKIVLLTIIIMTACSVIKPVPIETGTSVHVKDSTAIHYIDSVRIHEETRYRDMAWLGERLEIEGQRSRMWAEADTLKEILIGGLEEDEVEEKTRIVYRDRVEYRDSIRIEEKPVPVEKIVERKIIPRFWRFFGILGIILSCLLLFKVYLKVKEKFL